jgi:UDP-3-O-[3-hydroxymyristoyl] N-acetylglucosamine deacetylase
MHQTNQTGITTTTTGDRSSEAGHAAEHCAPQRTLRHAISCVGVGRHSGARVGLTLQPAATGTGVRFRRSDRPGAPSVSARPEHLVIAEHALVLADGDDTRIVGIEHVVAALAMTGIDNAIIDVSGAELPAMDGSAQPFVFLIECAGATEQDAARAPCPSPAAIDLRHGETMARMAPSVAPHVASDISGHVVAGTGPARHAVALERDALRHELAAARLPLTTVELEEAQGRGLMRGVSLDNTLLFEAARPLNAGGLRFPDEAARHANLLALAALALLGGLPPVELLTRGASYTLLARLLRQCCSASRQIDVSGIEGAAPASGTGTLASIGQHAVSPA